MKKHPRKWHGGVESRHALVTSAPPRDGLSDVAIDPKAKGAGVAPGPCHLKEDFDICKS